MVITNVRADWLFVWEPSNKGKYSICCIMPKDHPQLPEVQSAIDKAIAKGIEKGLFTAGNTKSASFKRCLRDGDEEIETEDRPAHYANCVFFNANNKTQPGIVDQDVKPLMDQEKLYSGCFVNVDINFYPYAHPEGGKGIGAGFNHVMLVREGDRLDGRKSVEEAFAGLTPDDDGLK